VCGFSIANLIQHSMKMKPGGKEKQKASCIPFAFALKKGFFCTKIRSLKV